MLLLILIALAIPGAPNQSRAKVLSHDHAIVTPRRIERAHGKGEDRWEDVTILPVITGLPPQVLKRVRKEVELKNVVGGFFYKVYKARQLINFDYRVNYNRHQILSMTFTWNAMFNHYERLFVFDLRNGDELEAEDLFREDQVDELVKLIDQKLRNEVEQMIREYKGDGDFRGMLEAQGRMTVTPDDLAQFQINDKGITFFYDPGFHHTAAWLEPPGRYFFTYSELKPFLKPDTVVSQFVK